MLGGKWELLVIRPKLANEVPPLRKLIGPLLEEELWCPLGPPCPLGNPELTNNPVVECPPGDPNV